MEENKTPPTRAVRLMAFGVSAAVFILALLTAVAVPLSIYTATGRGEVIVDASLDEPFVLELFDGRRVSINPAGVSLFENFPRGEENATFQDIPPPLLEIRVADDDIDARLINTVSLVALLGAVWFGLISLWEVTSGARSGAPFTDRSVRRLRFVALAVLAILVIDIARALLLTRAIDSAVAVRVNLGSDPWVLVTVAVAFLALSWIFGEANRLRRFEESTI